MTRPIPFTPDLSVKPEVTGFFDAQTNTICYVVKDPSSDACAVDRFRHGHRLCRRPHHP